MKPFFFDLENGSQLIILPEKKEIKDSHTYTFQLYCGNKHNLSKSLNDLNNYSGLVSFDWASQEFYYTPGNILIPRQEILKLIELIKAHTY